MKTEQYLYKLTLVPRLVDQANWTEREHAVVAEHFQALQQLQQENKLILAGRTIPADDAPFGIVIFTAESAEEAAAIMQSDPAVKENVMTAELFPYRVALFNNSFTV